MNFLLLLGLGVVGLVNCAKSGCQKDLRNSMATKRTREEEMEKMLSDAKQASIAHQVEIDYVVGKYTPKCSSLWYVRQDCLEECRRRIIAEGLEPNDSIISSYCCVY